MSVPREPEAEPPVPRPTTPSPRIGDVERDKAVAYLQEHMAQGRLTTDEFDERLTRALSARTADDLRPLFEDLPEPRPSGLAATPTFAPPPWSAGATAAVPAPVPPAAPVPATSGQDDAMPRGAKLAIAAIWPAAILLSFATDFRLWWIWIAAVVLTGFIRRGFGPDDRDHHRMHGRDDGPPSLGR